MSNEAPAKVYVQIDPKMAPLSVSVEQKFGSDVVAYVREDILHAERFDHMATQKEVLSLRKRLMAETSGV